MKTRTLKTHTLKSLGLVCLLSLGACSDDPVDPQDDVAIIVPDAGDDTTEDVQADTDDDVGEDAAADTSVDTVEPDAVEPDAVEPDAEEDVAEDVVEDVPPPRCTATADCNDGLACTTDRCDEDLGYCVWEIKADTCLIGATCYDELAPSRRDSCSVCSPEDSQTAWTPAAVGTSCAGDACTVDAACNAEGACVGEPLACEDGNACTENSCDPELGCVFPDVPAETACDDGSPCTVNDMCSAGSCAGEALDCGDDNVCTDDSCDPDTGACVNAFNTAPCSDGDACTSGDVCNEGACEPLGVTNCVDGNECTIDFCDPIVGCSYLPNLNPCCTGTTSICDDGNACTTDICEPESGNCSYEANEAVCDDGNACTQGDSCAEMACGGDAVLCDADNVCLAAECDEDDGCFTTPLTGNPCDDGVACTVEDTCNAGVCVGVSECVCEPTFGLQAIKVTGLLIGDGGQPGQALDLDVNPATCAPRTDCSAGLHNALGVIGGFANDSLVDSVAEGSLMLVLDVDNIALNPFRISIFQAELDADNADCDFQTEDCEYVVDRGTLDPDTCEPLVTLAATRAGNRITAGGRGTVFPFEIPLGDAVLAITLYDVRFEGDIVIEDGVIVSLDGVLGGAVPRADLLAALEAVPAESLPVDPATIANLLNLLVVDDIDTDGDGTPDAASIGLPLTGIAASVVGAE